MMIKHKIKARYKNVVITVTGKDLLDAVGLLTNAALKEGCSFSGCNNGNPDDKLYIIESKPVYHE